MNIYQAFNSGHHVLRRKAWCDDIALNILEIKNDRFDFSRDDILANDWEIVKFARINCVDLRRAWSKALSKVSMDEKNEWTHEELCKIMNYNYEVYKNLELELGLKKP